LQHDHRQHRPADGEAHGAVDAVESVGGAVIISGGVAGREGRPATGSEAERVGAGVHLAAIGVDLIAADAVAIGEEALGDAAGEFVVESSRSSPITSPPALPMATITSSGSFAPSRPLGDELLERERVLGGVFHPDRVVEALAGEGDGLLQVVGQGS
jgi:hypothetical protein